MKFFMLIITDIPILIVLTVFIVSIVYCVKKYRYVNKNLKNLINFLSNFSKSDLNFRFKEIDEGLINNPYISTDWLEFKNSLVFSESVALKDKNNDLTYENISSTVQNIRTTVDPQYFFNEETLVTSKYNNKFIQTIPTVLTGCGPLFTFLNIAIAFGKMDFSSQDQTIASVSNLMQSMQVAALVSVIAVGSSIIFLLTEKLTYNALCKHYLSIIENQLCQLFDNISAEKFLFELLKETKIQNNAFTNLIETLPEQFKVALESGISENLVPYLENAIFGLNQLNSQIKKQQKNGDIVDNLF